MRAMSYRKGSHTVYDIKYHIVWITKYRKPVLRGEVGKQVRELVRQTPRDAQRGWFVRGEGRAKPGALKQSWYQLRCSEKSELKRTKPACWAG